MANNHNETAELRPFHLAVPVTDLEESKKFYVNVLGCRERSHNSGAGFIVMNFHGAQLVLVEAPDHVEPSREDAGAEPYKHFGIIMEWDAWHQLADELAARQVPFRIKPNIKEHAGIGAVGNLFITDPAGNYLEFKSYRDPSKIL